MIERVLDIPTDELRQGASDLAATAIGDRLEALEALAQELLRPGSSLQTVLPGGYAFLAGFLRRDNLEKLILRELPSLDAMSNFVSLDGRKSLKVLPKGTVCHWIAGNVPLLALFSWSISAALGNANMIRLSSRGEDFVSPVLDELARLSATGKQIKETTTVLRFERDDTRSHEAMSNLADVRIAWGGQDAVEAIHRLPRRWACEDIAFGPRVSLAVVDPTEMSDRMIDRLVMDVVYFDQLACSSPQHLYVKGARESEAFKAYVEKFTSAFANSAKAAPRHTLDYAETYRIALDRTRMLLQGGEIERDDETQWTVAVVDEPQLNVVGANRFLQIVPFEEPDVIYPYIPRNVQTVVTTLAGELFDRFTTEAANRGVCRFPRPGEGNHFENPWDGIPIVSRLTRWVSRTEPGDSPSK